MRAVASCFVVLAAFHMLAGCTTNELTVGEPGTLVRTEPILMGPICANGGTAILTGVDDDRDTYLDEEEVSSTQTLCNGAAPVQCQGGVSLPGPVIVQTDADLTQLEGVHCVDGDLLVSGVVATDLHNLANLNVVTGDFVLVANPALTSLAGLGQLKIVGGTFLIQGNEALVDLSGIGAFRMTSLLSIVGNNALPSLHGLEEVSELGGIQITNNQALESLQGFAKLTVCKPGNVSIRANGALVTTDGLAALREAVLIEVSGNRALKKATFQGLQRLTSRLIFNDDVALSAVEMPSLVAVGGFIQMNNNGALTSLSLPVLNTAAGLLMNGNNGLTSVTLPKLIFLTGNLDLRVLAALTTIDLPQLISVGGDTTFDTLAQLAGLSGLAELRSVGGNLTISNNGITTAVAQQFSDQISVGGTITIRNNR
ncbi:MAG: hypothetical protein KBG15_22170 [Kofleriaceae bacterium]|nr:hypothetical protein [Kofleriaceae bacterium]